MADLSSYVYVVTQEREVKVSATSPVEAAQLANAAFNDEIREGDLAQTHIVKAVRERSFNVREDS